MPATKLELVPSRRTEPWLPSASGVHFSHPLTFAEIQEKAPFGSRFFYELKSGATGFCTLLSIHMPPYTRDTDTGWFRCDSNVLTVITPKNLARLTYRCHMPLTPTEEKKEPPMPAPPSSSLPACYGSPACIALLKSLPTGTKVRFWSSCSPRTRNQSKTFLIPGTVIRTRVEEGPEVRDDADHTETWYDSIEVLEVVGVIQQPGLTALSPASPTAGSPSPVSCETGGDTTHPGPSSIPMKTQITTFISFTPRGTEEVSSPAERILREPITELADSATPVLNRIKVKELPGLIEKEKIADEDITLVKINYTTVAFSQASI